MADIERVEELLAGRYPGVSMTEGRASLLMSRDYMRVSYEASWAMYPLDQPENLVDLGLRGGTTCITYCDDRLTKDRLIGRPKVWRTFRVDGPDYTSDKERDLRAQLLHGYGLKLLELCPEYDFLPPNKFKAMYSFDQAGNLIRTRVGKILRSGDIIDVEVKPEAEFHTVMDGLMRLKEEQRIPVSWLEERRRVIGNSSTNENIERSRSPERPKRPERPEMPERTESKGHSLGWIGSRDYYEKQRNK